MKKHNVNPPIKIPKTLFFISIVVFLASFAMFFINNYVVKFIAMFPYFVSVCILPIGPVFYALNQMRYVYCDEYIQMFGLFKHKIWYKKYKAIAIVNAHTDGVKSAQTYITYTIKDSNGKKKRIVYPYIQLLKPNFITRLLKSGAFSSSIDSKMLGICWFDSFEELLEHCNLPVYIVEDVYLRFRGKFDEILQSEKYDIDRFIIAGEKHIKYAEYLKQDRP